MKTLLLTLLLVLPLTLLAKQTPLTCEVNFPSQGAKIGADAVIVVDHIRTSIPWNRGVIEITRVDPIRDTNPFSSTRSVVIQRNTTIACTNSQIDIPIKVTDSGEFKILLQLRITAPDGKTLAHSKSIFLIASDKQIWFGEGAISNATLNRALARGEKTITRQGNSTSPYIQSEAQYLRNIAK